MPGSRDGQPAQRWAERPTPAVEVRFLLPRLDLIELQQLAEHTGQEVDVLLVQAVRELILTGRARLTGGQLIIQEADGTTLRIEDGHG